MRIAILDDYQGVALTLAPWDSLGAEEIAVFRDSLADRAALIERLQRFQVVCLMRERTPFPKELIDALPNLQLIVTTGPRNAAIDVAAAAARGIPVCGTESRATPTVELALLLMIALSRRLLPEALSLRDGGWQAGLGRDLAGLTLGLVGLGRIGGQVARLAQGLGMAVTAWSQNLTEARCAELGVARAPDLPALLAGADLVSIHLVLSERSRGLIGAAELAAMKPDAGLINTSRGPIVDWPALLAALEAGRPGAAALDVYEEEPLPADHPLHATRLIDEGRLLLTPHLGYATRQTFELFYRQTVEAIAAWRAAAPIRVIAS
ncbi:Lactate dehydrogenase [Tistlia consotensis]|uniref:Lactate dehydrogenase n=1 Tax=Tistlia consotensis USBA 355 TaxID=560819 RepID=A0A1Y6C6J0_9PROT|nr:D-2-hydroxyacid dehydrogenase family protein [Tistlia consotensis]SMF38797.1 Lactate dehydrogenase [Tistlia consotensis USBA 355]SNR36831.1 Lactate dehydrogenase [Tistlia consotensis]